MARLIPLGLLLMMVTIIFVCLIAVVVRTCAMYSIETESFELLFLNNSKTPIDNLLKEIIRLEETEANLASLYRIIHTLDSIWEVWLKNQK